MGTPVTVHSFAAADLTSSNRSITAKIHGTYIRIRLHVNYIFRLPPAQCKVNENCSNKNVGWGSSYVPRPSLILQMVPGNEASLSEV